MIWARRIAILAAWSALAFVLYGVLMFAFTFGDCRGEDLPCRQRQQWWATVIPVAMGIAYVLGLVALLRRWIMRRAG